MSTAAASVYRPRHPESTPLCRMFEERFEDFVRSYTERFEHRHGRLRPVVRRVVEQYLECGHLHGGFVGAIVLDHVAGPPVFRRRHQDSVQEGAIGQDNKTDSTTNRTDRSS